MRFLLILVISFSSHFLCAQELSYVKDSVMHGYMKSGVANKKFVPKGKEDKNKQRQGFWMDYEVSGDVSFQGSDEHIETTSGQYLLYGEGNYVNGKREGDWNIYIIIDKSFKKILHKRVNYINSFIQGMVTYYFPNEKIAFTINAKDGKNDGKGTVNYPNGSKFADVEYTMGKRSGNHHTYYSNGATLVTKSYLNDSLHGSFRSYYSDGQLKESSEFFHGKANGTYKYYYPDGQLWTEKEFKNGLLWNVISNYNAEGRAVDTGTVKDGNGTAIYYTEKGSIYLIQTLKEGVIVSEDKRE